MPQPEQKRSVDEPTAATLNPPRSPGVTPTWSIVDVTTIEGCRTVAELCRATPRISIDTETYDWLPDKGTGGPTPATVGKLALLQIGLPDTRQAFIIDIVALEGAGADWRGALGQIIESPTPQKIVHFGPFERAVFEGCGLTFDAGVIDTCAVAKAVWKELQELHPGISSKSLKSLSYYLLGKDISKAEQSSDWRARPLTPEQRAYAALDVELAADICTALGRLAAETGIDPLQVEWRNNPRHRA